MTDAHRYRLDDLRRFASALAVASGIAPARASALATHLLWFDAAGAAQHGIEALPDLLDRIDSGTIDPRAEGRVTSERTATAVLDGERGLPLLVLDRAAVLATEKARDCGVGLVRIHNVDAIGSVAGVVAEAAIGPVTALALGPGPSWAVAVPSDQGLPLVFDPALAARPARGKGGARRAVAGLIAPWSSALAGDDDWLVACISASALDPLATVHERVAGVLSELDEEAGRLLPAPWEERRRAARGHGVAVRPGAWDALLGRAARAGVEPPHAIPAPERT